MFPLIIFRSFIFFLFERVNMNRKRNNLYDARGLLKNVFDCELPMKIEFRGPENKEQRTRMHTSGAPIKHEFQHDVKKWAPMFTDFAKKSKRRKNSDDLVKKAITTNKWSPKTRNSSIRSIIRWWVIPSTAWRNLVHRCQAHVNAMRRITATSSMCEVCCSEMNGVASLTTTCVFFLME